MAVSQYLGPSCCLMHEGARTTCYAVVTVDNSGERMLIVLLSNHLSPCLQMLSQHCLSCSVICTVNSCINTHCHFWLAVVCHKLIPLCTACVTKLLICTCAGCSKAFSSHACVSVIEKNS